MEPAPGMLVREGIRLVRPLASGAMGSVWVAEHSGLKTEVAVKFVHANVARDDPAALKRFEREASAAARIKSPHVVQVFDSGVTHDGRPYIVMELLEGESLRERLMREGRLGLRETGELVAQVGRCLDKAHQLGIVHRDIKPANIFLVRDDRMFAKLLDFGIAKMSEWSSDASGKITNPENLVGTPAYMSRDQIMANRDIDAYADLWGLTVCAYEALTGQLPFDGESMGLICVAICKGGFTAASQLRPELADHIDHFFTRAFHADPEQRYPSARELAFTLLSHTTAAEEISGIEHALDESGRFRLPMPPSGSGRIARVSYPSSPGRISKPPSMPEPRGVSSPRHMLPSDPSSGPGRAMAYQSSTEIMIAPPPEPAPAPAPTLTLLADDSAARAALGSEQHLQTTPLGPGPDTLTNTAASLIHNGFPQRHRWPRAAIGSVAITTLLAIGLLAALVWGEPPEGSVATATTGLLPTVTLPAPPTATTATTSKPEPSAAPAASDSARRYFPVPTRKPPPLSPEDQLGI